MRSAPLRRRIGPTTVHLGRTTSQMPRNRIENVPARPKAHGWAQSYRYTQRVAIGSQSRNVRLRMHARKADSTFQRAEPETRARGFQHGTRLNNYGEGRQAQTNAIPSRVNSTR